MLVEVFCRPQRCSRSTTYDPQLRVQINHDPGRHLEETILRGTGRRVLLRRGRGHGRYSGSRNSGEFLSLCRMNNRCVRRPHDDICEESASMRDFAFVSTVEKYCGILSWCITLLKLSLILRSTIGLGTALSGIQGVWSGSLQIRRRIALGRWKHTHIIKRFNNSTMKLTVQCSFHKNSDNIQRVGTNFSFTI